ncbi:hypothetical protein [Spiroplasma endosymbiont of Panorpa germanica]|uniref:hypothetical protein n=1 Tax=Spiroplasma endosymbiont of Panorpa germanica TaxID=3066314 RepID=UPI0030D52CD7
MKKLISMLAATSLVVTAPLSVVACKSKVNLRDNFDYTQLISNFLSLCELIFIEQMSDDLGEYFFIDTTQAQNMDIDFDSLWDLVSLENGDTLKLSNSSEEFTNLQSFFTRETNYDKLRAEASKQIVSDINYKPILNDGRNPFSWKINLEEVTLIQKSDQDDSDKVLSINYKLSTKIEYLNSRQDVEYQTVYFDSSMTIFTDRDVSDTFNELSDITKEKITSDKYSNRYEFESNNSNLDETFANIKNSSNFSAIFDSEIKADILEELDSTEEFIFDSSDIKFESSRDWRRFIDPTRAVGSVGGTWNYSKWSLLVKDAFTKDEEYLQAAVDQAEDESALTSPSQNLLNYLKTDADSSQHLNAFTLFDNYLNDFTSQTLRLKVSNNNINLDTDLDSTDEGKLANQRRTIGFIGTDIKNIKVTYKPLYGSAIELELPEQFIVNRQLTTFSNTKDLFKQHVRANLLFEKEMFGFNKEQSDIPTEDYGDIFKLTKPNGFEEDFVPGEKYNFKEIFNMIFEETLEKVNVETKKEGWTASDYIAGYYFVFEPSYFKINDQGYLFLYDQSDVLINQGRWNLTSGTPLIDGGTPDMSHTQAIHFDIGKWNHKRHGNFGDTETFLKF